MTLYRGPSAAQNGTVIQTCKQCGAINQGSTELCCFCEARLNFDEQPAGVSPASAKAASPTNTLKRTGAPGWRQEVSKRLRSYHARQSGTPEEAGEEAPEEIEEPQGALPFEMREEEPVTPGSDEMEDPMQATLASASARFETQQPLPRPGVSHDFEQMVIDVSRPPITDSASSQGKWGGTMKPEANHEQQPSLQSPIPVAELALRRRAGMVDAICLLVASTGILGLFAAFGGRIVPGKVDLLICAAVLGLLYTQYFTLFTMMGGATPGMMFAGLRVVSYEGKTPDPGRLIWRSVGYTVSGATAMLGYLWAFWDQDQLTWHDRISQTYVARAESLFETRPARGTGDWLPHPHI